MLQAGALRDPYKTSFECYEGYEVYSISSAIMKAAKCAGISCAGAKNPLYHNEPDKSETQIQKSLRFHFLTNASYIVVPDL